MNSPHGIAFDGRIYRVFPYDPTKKCSKGDAYHFNDDMAKGIIPLYNGLVLPCRGKCTIQEFKSMSLPGIYITDKGQRMILPDKKGVYSISRVKPITDPTLHQEVNVDDSDGEIATHMTGGAYIPRINNKDDFLNKLFKMFLSLKRVSLEAYSSRLGSERYNFKRAMETNNSLSPTKFNEYCKSFQGMAAIIICDKPDAKHPMGRKIVIFTDEPFDFNDCIVYEEAEEILSVMNKDDDDFFDE